VGQVGQAYEYYAFISYSRRNEEWAKWLQKKLEQYRLPTVLRKEEQSLPKKIQPIFRDKTDLTTGQLQSALHQQLNSSKKLIVLCSPASARSEWVNKEVQRFIDAGRIQDIIPLIVEGIPNSGDANECFPPALRLPEDEQLLGVSIPELGKNDAFLRVVAGLLDIKFDQLKRRHEQRRKRQNLLVSAAAVLAFIIAALSGYLAWDYLAPHESYYADYVMRWGVPEGIGRLTKKEIASMEGHYTIVTQRRLVRTLIYANSAGTPMEHLEDEFKDRPMIMRFYYRDDGRIEYVEYVDNNGRVLTTQVYTTDLKSSDFQVSAVDSSIKTLSGTTTSTETGMFDLNFSSIGSQRSDIARYDIEYDANGYITKIVYMRDRRTPILDADGIGGLEYTLDALGRPIEIRYLGLSGNGYSATKKNVAGKRIFYDEAGRRVRIEYFDPQGNLTLNDQGWMVQELTYDANGNNIRKSFLDANGAPTIMGSGYSYSVLKYNEKGNFISVEYFNREGEPVKHVVGAAVITKEYDNNGRMIRQSYFDDNNRLTLIISGHAIETIEYDERGNHIFEAFFDRENNPLLNNDGYASHRMTFDDRGNRIREEYFGENNMPIINVYGYASWTAVYDEKDNITSMSFFDTKGMPIIIGGGFATRLNYYDERGNMVRIEYLGKDGNPILGADGCAAVEYDFDSGGNVSAHRYYGLDGKLTLNDEGYASLTSEFDERGNITRIAYYGLSDELVLTYEGYAVMEGEYDERGNVTKMSFFGVQGELVNGYDGAAVIAFEYDDRNNLIKSSYFGTDGKPSLNEEGISVVVFEVDAHGNATMVRYFGTDGKPINGREGYASIVTEFNEFGKPIDVYLLNANGEKLTRYAVAIDMDPFTSEDDTMGIMTGDIFITYADWVWFDKDTTDLYDTLYSLITEVIATANDDNVVVLYRISTQSFTVYEFAPEFDVAIGDYWLSDADYQKIRVAFAMMPG